MTNRKHLIIIAAGVLILLAASATYFWRSAEAPEPEMGIHEGFKAVDLSIEGLNGETFVLSEHLGKVVVLEFMTTWCPGCARQHLELKKLYKALDGFELVTIEIDVMLREESFERWATQKEYEWFVGHSPISGRKYQTALIPTILVIDKKGIIRYRGNFTPHAALEAIIKKYQKTTSFF